MAQPPGRYARAGPPYRNLIPPGPGPPQFPFHRQRRFQFRLARKSYGAQVGLAGRNYIVRRLHLNDYDDDDENVITSTTSSTSLPPVNSRDWRIRVINRSYDVLIRSNLRCGIPEEDEDDEGVLTKDHGKMRSLTEQVLSNHLIWHILGRHLSLSDLKICRLVSLAFNHHILNSTNFTDRALVNLTPHLLRPDEFGTTQVAWKHISLPVQRVCEKSECAKVHLHNLTWLIPMLSELESLTLLKGPPCPVNIAAISPPQSLMIKASKKLKDLTVDEELLYYSVFKKCSAQLSRLESFKIATKTDMSCSTALYAAEKMLNVTKNLKVFKSSFEMDPQAHRHSLESNIQIMSLLVKQNASTLQILKPRDPLFWTRDGFLEYEPISDLTFPQLTSVRICLTSQNVHDVIKFIKGQPKLSQLTLDSFDSVDEVFPNMVLSAVAEISGRLKKLDVKAREFRNLMIIDWKFLKNSNIQDFSIWPWNCRLYADQAIKGARFVPEVLKYLPQNVKRVRLQSGFVAMNSNNERDWPTQINLGRIDPQVLTCLCLSRMAGFVSDTTLEYIFRNFLKLKELHLSHLDDRVTEFGFTGVSLQRPQSEFSIQNLKGLESLTIRRCKAISNFSLLKAFKFQELTYLDLSCNPNINLQGCIAVAQQNPSLEVFMNDHMSEFPLEESVRRKNFPRLKSLQNWLIDRD